MQRNLRNLSLLSALTLISGLLACGSDDGNAPLTNEQILTSRPWQNTQMNFQIDLEPEFLSGFIPAEFRQINALDNLEPCALDDVTLFANDATFTTEDYELDCPGFEPTEGEWAASSDFSTFTLFLEELPFEVPVPQGLPLPVDLESFANEVLKDMVVEEFDMDLMELTKTQSFTLENVEIPDFPIPLDITIIIKARVVFENANTN